jgi:hypothetical protein
LASSRGHVPILIHYGVNRHTVDKSGGLSVIIPKYFVVKEEVQKQRVSIEHITTTLMIADPLTKGLPPKTFKEHVNKMGLDYNPLCP